MHEYIRPNYTGRLTERQYIHDIKVYKNCDKAIVFCYIATTVNKRFVDKF